MASMDTDMSIDNNYLDISEFVLDPIEWEVAKVLKMLTIEDYDIIPSPSNPRIPIPQRGLRHVRKSR